MIQGHRDIPDLDALHLSLHRILFQNCLGVIEKVATVAPTADTLPVGYMQFSLIGGVRNIYFNSAGIIVKVSVESDVNAKAAKGANTDITSLSGLTTPLSRAQGGLASTVANNAASGVVFLDANSKLPAVDGSQLTGIVMGKYSGSVVFNTAAIPSAWTDLDLSAVVGANRALVYLKIDTTNAIAEVTFRTKGDTGEVLYNSGYCMGASGSAVPASGVGYVTVVTDTSGVVQWKYASSAANGRVVLVGYIKLL